MSIHLVGGGWNADGDPEVTGAFLAEAAQRAAVSARMSPRIGMLLVVDDDGPAEEEQAAQYRTGYPASFEKVAPCQPIVTVIPAGTPFDSSVLSDIDGLVIGGGLTPAYLASVLPLIEEIRLLVADGLPYLGFSAGAMIAADRAIVGGWRIAGIPVCPPDTGEDLDEVTIVEGIGLVDLAVDVHAAQWGTLSRLVAATEAGLVEGGVAIDEGTVLVVTDSGLRVAGAGNVWRVLEEDGRLVVGTLDA